MSNRTDNFDQYDQQDFEPVRQQSVGRQMIKVQSLRRIGKEEQNVEEDDGDDDVEGGEGDGGRFSKE